MSDPIGTFTTYDLVTRVAKEAGLGFYGLNGTEPAMIPIDAHDLDLCLGIVNRGILMFQSDAPPNGWRWRYQLMYVLLAPAITGTATAGTSTSLTCGAKAGTYADNYFNTYTLWITDGTGKDQTAVVTDYTGSTGKFDFSGGFSGGATPDTTTVFSISCSASVVHGESSRYLMPAGFNGSADGRIVYDRNTRHSTIINWVDESEIRQRRSVVELLGYPLWATLRPLSASDSTTYQLSRRQWELVVNPRPVKADTLVFPYTAYFDRLDIVSGKATGGSSTTLADSTRTEADDYFNGWIIHVISGTGKSDYAIVTNYTGATGTFEVADWLGGAADPTSNSIYYAEPPTNTHPAGLQHDNAILAACLGRVSLEIENSDQKWIEKYYQRDLKQAYLVDQRTAPRTLGRLSYGPKPHPSRTWKDVTTKHDIDF